MGGVTMPTEHCRASLEEIVQCMFATFPEKISGLIAAAAMIAPVLHVEIKAASDEAALLLPLVGLGFFALRYYQAVLDIRERRRRLERDDPPEYPGGDF